MALRTLVVLLFALAVPGYARLVLDEIPAENPAGTVSVRFFSALTDVKGVDLYVGDKRIGGGLELGWATKFVTLPAGPVEVTVKHFGAVELLSTVKSSFLSEGVRYTLVLLDAGKGIEIVPLALHNAPTKKEAAVRFLNLSPNVGPVDFAIVTPAEPPVVLARDVVPDRIGDYLEPIPNGLFKLDVTPTGAITVLAAEFEYELAEFASYTTFLVGKAGTKKSAYDRLFVVTLLDYKPPKTPPVLSAPLEFAVNDRRFF